MNESSGVLAMLAAGVPDGPRDHELMSLYELSVRVMVFGDMDPFPAQYRTLAALLGNGDLQGQPPASLPLYHRCISGPVLLDPTGPEFDGFKYPAPRVRALCRLPSGLYSHKSIDRIPAGYCDDEPAGRFLAVVRADALKAFGLPDPASLQVPPTPAPTAIQSDPTPAPGVVKSSSSRRKGALSAVFCRAKQKATEPGCPHSVWAALVDLAQGQNPPPELTDYHPKNGIQATGTRSGWLKKAAFMERWRRDDV